LVSDGLLERRRYQRRPVRYEYVPTEKSRELSPIFLTLIRWGTKWLSPEGPTVEIVDGAVRPGPAAGPEILERERRLQRAVAIPSSR
jgi:hypothetical protein